MQPIPTTPQVESKLDAEALAFISGFQNPNVWFLATWKPRYRETLERVEHAFTSNDSETLFEIFWKTADNSISNAGPGLLSYDEVDALHDELIAVLADIKADGSSQQFDRIVERFTQWKSEERVSKVPRLLIARAFAGIHPSKYHTTVGEGYQNQLLAWFAAHTGFNAPRTNSWSSAAESLVGHLQQLGIFGDDYLGRNMFPWFVLTQLRARMLPMGSPPGHTPRSIASFANLPASRRAIALRHNEVQTELYNMLAIEFGKNAVWTEYATGNGGFADAIVRHQDGRCWLYEIKIASSASMVVRQALGQLLEYAFRPGGLEPAKLIVVGEPPLDELTSAHLTRLRSEFSLNVTYLQVPLRTGSLHTATQEEALFT